MTRSSSTQREGLTPEQRQALLDLAREAIAAHLGGDPAPRDPPADEALSRKAGAFVSLHLDGHLRGCIGTFSAGDPLYRAVREMAVAAATRDPRFRPMASLDELGRVHIEISVLSPRMPVEPENVEVGRHGVFITRGIQRGVLLPQVAAEQGWDRITFLEHTCRKAGLSPDAWKDPDTIVEVFTAEVFS